MTTSCDHGARTLLTPKLYSPAQAAAVLGISRSTVYEMMNAGQVRSVRIMRTRKIPVSEIERLVAEGC